MRRKTKNTVLSETGKCKKIVSGHRRVLCGSGGQKGGQDMAKKRANGEDNIRKRKDGRWEGRYTAGYDPATGKRIIKNVLGKTQAEVKEKLARAIEDNKGLDVVKAGQYTVGQWMCGLRTTPKSRCDRPHTKPTRVIVTTLIISEKP